jgi:eukaryotic-like serine/threonine-protein kinase
MKSIRICPGCGTPLPPDAPAGLCPCCLLQSAPTLSSDTDTRPGSPAPVRRSVPIPGQTFGNYRILRLLGQGGMGEVYEAEHLETQRPVALKVMGHALSSDQDRKRFLREGRLAASVNHPNVVYIYGSEEIEGAPVIAMELVRDGTLKDCLKQRGPLDIAEAVEATLQIIAGLEAAHHAAVLHRDIKPANCFVAADGTVKVGDFGLSISTLARGESLLTASGSVLGTPAYASPEQLRGEELDVRADIYSVGGTLYHLLTGQTPFAGADFVKLITEVLDKPPVPPQSVRPEIPAELARVILRCLAKDRQARFQTYAALREALLPFARREMEPAKPSQRFLASVVDEFVAYAPSLWFLVYWQADPLEQWLTTRTLSALLSWSLICTWYLLYYALTEGLWGAGVGKTLCGLRVVRRDGQRPGAGRAGLRALVYLAPYVLPSLALMALIPAEEIRAALARGDLLLSEWLWLPLLALLFVTMRRRNGYAALHDFASGTRVVLRPRTEPRPTLAEIGHPISVAHSIPEATGGSAAAVAKWGPYEVRTTLWQKGPEELLLAVDPALRRSVWIHLRPVDTKSVPPARQALSRSPRLRWLTGGRTATRVWEAYQAVDGTSLLALRTARVPWRALQFWLLDLATEIACMEQETDEVPTLAPDRVWIAANGHALLLDFPAPDAATGGGDCVSAPLQGVEAMQQFLDAVARCALGEPRAGATPVAGRLDWRAAIPLPAQGFLGNLARRTFDRTEMILGNLHSLVAKPAELSRPWRAASLAFGPTLFLSMGLLVAAMLTVEQIRWERAWANAYPGKPSLRVAAQVYADQMEYEYGTQRQTELIRAHFVHHFGPVVTNESFWNQAHLSAVIPENQRTLLRQVAADQPIPQPEVVAEAELAVVPLMRQQVRAERLQPLGLFIGMFAAGALLQALLELGGCLLFGISPTLRLFGVAVVGRSGTPAARGRLCLRWFLAWGPVALILGGGAALVVIEMAALTEEISAAWFAVAVTVVGVGALLALGVMIHAVLRPHRGWVDALAGTQLVPR